MMQEALNGVDSVPKTMFTARFIRTMPLLALASILGGCGGKSPGAASKPHSVTLSWKASTSKVSAYHIYRSTDPKSQPGFLAVAPPDQTQYIDGTVQGGRAYYYSVKAVAPDGTESDFSDKILATIPRD